MSDVKDIIAKVSQMKDDLEDYNHMCIWHVKLQCLCSNYLLTVAVIRFLFVVALPSLFSSKTPYVTYRI